MIKNICFTTCSFPDYITAFQFGEKPQLKTIKANQSFTYLKDILGTHKIQLLAPCIRNTHCQSGLLFYVIGKYIYFKLLLHFCRCGMCCFRKHSYRVLLTRMCCARQDLNNQVSILFNNVITSLSISTEYKDLRNLQIHNDTCYS